MSRSTCGAWLTAVRRPSNRAPAGAGRADDCAAHTGIALELFAELLEQVYVLCLFACELKEGAHAIIVALKLRPGVVEHEREYELFDHAEKNQVGVPANLV